MTTLTYTLPAVNCGHCKMTVERELSRLSGVVSVNVDVDAKRVTVQFDAPATEASIAARLREIGYPPAE